MTNYNWYDTDFMSTKGTILLPDKLMLLSARQFFSNINDGKYKYTNDPMKTGILIELRDTKSEEHTDKKPAIIISSSAMQWSNIAIADAGDKYNTINAYGSGVDLLSGTITFSVFSRNAAESRILAWTINLFVKIFQPYFRKIGFYDVSPKVISATSPAVQESLYITSASVAIVMSVEWVDRLKKALWEGCLKIDDEYNYQIIGDGECK